MKGSIFFIPTHQKGLSHPWKDLYSVSLPTQRVYPTHERIYILYPYPSKGFFPPFKGSIFCIPSHQKGLSHPWKDLYSVSLPTKRVYPTHKRIYIPYPYPPKGSIPPMKGSILCIPTHRKGLGLCRSETETQMDEARLRQLSSWRFYWFKNHEVILRWCQFKRARR